LFFFLCLYVLSTDQKAALMEKEDVDDWVLVKKKKKGIFLETWTRDLWKWKKKLSKQKLFRIFLWVSNPLPYKISTIIRLTQNLLIKPSSYNPSMIHKKKSQSKS
jgi:hypothetical protein